MEFKRIYLPYKVNQKIEKNVNVTQLTWSACDDKSTHKVDKQIEQLLADGFKIVSTCAITECANLFIRNGENEYASYTKGIEVFMVKD